MVLYKKLAQIGFLKNSYAFKFLFVAFIGIHIPLIGLLFFVLYGSRNISPNTILFFALVMTLTATILTLLILKRLIKPIEVASKALNDYRTDRIFSELPLNFSDEAGLLMRNIHESIQDNETFIKDKQDMVYLLSHDLRTFAGNPQAIATLILDENPSAAIKELAELIVESSKQQLIYIENFIKILKDQDQFIKKTEQKNRIRPAELIAFVTELVSQSLNKKNIKLISEIEVSEVFLKIDQDSLLSVLSNLVNNAIKFSFPDSEVRIRIYLEAKKIIFSVSDSGIGFDSNQKEALFQKFTKESRLGTSNEPSTGIGLYLSKSSIEKHGGSLIAISDAGKGATFTIALDA